MFVHRFFITPLHVNKFNPQESNATTVVTWLAAIVNMESYSKNATSYLERAKTKTAIKSLYCCTYRSGLFLKKALVKEKEKSGNRMSYFIVRSAPFALSMVFLRSILAGQMKVQCPQPSQRFA